MKRSAQQGMVLVAVLLILALLSLLGASSLLTATLDSQITGNLARHGEAFHASEAALEVGVGRVIGAFRTTLNAYIPGAAWTPPAVASGDAIDSAYHNYNLEFRISNALNPLAPNTEPQGTSYSTVQYGETLLHSAYLYKIEGKATGPTGSSTVTETLRVLETPLVQYYVFYHDDLSFHSGLGMTSWGRVHTNGNLYLAAVGGLQFQNYDTQDQVSPNQLTIHGTVTYGAGLAEGPRGTTFARAPGTMQVRVRNLNTIPSANLNADSQAITQSITPANQGAQEALFRDAGNTYHLKIGVEELPGASIASLGTGGFYDLEARSPRKPGVDGMRIVIQGGALKIWLSLNGGAAVDVTDHIENYRVAVGQPINWNNRWQPNIDATTNANGALAANVNQLIPRSMVYSPESLVRRDESSFAVDIYNNARNAGSNPRYPCVLERADPREVREVDLTVIDLQRLELWYFDYLDWQDNGVLDLSIVGKVGWDPANQRSLLIYVSRFGAAPTTGGALQAVKLIGSRAGRTRGGGMAANRQSRSTLVTRTTLVTDNALYLDGDFNAPGASAGNNGPDIYGCALISDATTLLSNNWGNILAAGNVGTYGATGGVYNKPAASDSAYNAAFFTGRYNFLNGNTRNGSAGNTTNEAGIHNLLRFIEDWSTPNATDFTTGSLVNLWFSAQADKDFICCGTGVNDVYNRPQRVAGWDRQFGTRSYWPPYVPSIYTLERVSWQEQ